MKVKTKASSLTTPFTRLTVGEVFRFTGKELYMKTDERLNTNAACLQTGVTTYFDSYHTIIPINGTFIEE
jgi:hypothetical protein